MSDLIERLTAERDRHVIGYPGPRRNVAELIDQAITALSAAEQRVQEARRIALEEAAKVADEAAEMRERLFNENGGLANAGKSLQALAIAVNIRALHTSEPQPEKDKNQDDAEGRE
ncbi:MAG: hypothetical protein PGN22_03175 [Agrobacterium cavarae]